MPRNTYSLSSNGIYQDIEDTVPTKTVITTCSDTTKFHSSNSINSRSFSAQTSTSTLSPEINRYEKTCIGFLNGPTITHKIMMPGNSNSMYKSQQTTNFNTNIIYDPPTSSSPLMYSTEESTATSVSDNYKGGTTNRQQVNNFFNPGTRDVKIVSKKHAIIPNDYMTGDYNKISNGKTFFSRLNFQKISISLAIALIIAMIIIIYLLIGTASSGEDKRYTVYDPSLHSIYPKNKKIDAGYKNGIVVPLPHQFSINEIVTGDLIPGRISYTSFEIDKDSPVNFNISVTPTARIVMYSRQTVPPTPSMNDFREVILADRLHLNNNNNNHKERKIRSDKKTYTLKTTLISQFLLSGKWFIGFLNDGDQVQPITFILTVSSHYNGPFDSSPYSENFNTPLLSNDKDSCKFDCFGKGDCKDGKCLCHPGFSGLYCQETSCPVLCSGNGIFSNGKCICHSGYKGFDCDMPISWCEVPNCNGNGRCNNNGVCECKDGWKGSFCDEKDCENNCNDHGICKDGKCYCENGYFSNDCSKNIRDVGNLKSNNVVKDDRIINVENNYGNKAALINVNNHHDVPSNLCNLRGVYNTTTSSCNCLPGYKGKRCEEVGCSIDCGEHGKCISNNICICEESYEGEYCERKSCLHECNINGKCDGNGNCICNIGWNGENCLIEGCKNNCNGNGECKKDTNDKDYKCYCNDSFHGDMCEYQKEDKCDDGIDNDGDGLKDCEDPDCCGTSHCIDEGLCPNIPRPSVVAKRLSNNHSNSKSFFNRHKFLIAPNSIQYYSQESSFIHNQVSIVRGRVLSYKAGALSGVRISDESDPKHGFTLTRTGNETGLFDLMVNGGSIVSLRFMRTPFERVYKNIFIKANEIVYIGDIYMDENIKKSSEISLKCTDILMSHTIEPTAIPYWKLNQHSSYPDNHQNPILFAESGALFDSIPIQGSNIKLIYSSETSSNSYSKIFLQLVGSTYPMDLHLIHLKITVGGKEYSSILSVKTNLNHIFYWDKNNAYNEPIYGLTTAIISIGYQYKDCGEAIVWKTLKVTIEGRSLRKKSITLGGWNMNNNHFYDYTNNILERGDGKRSLISEEQRGIEMVVGGNKKREVKCVFCGKQKIDEALLYEPKTLAIGRKGQVFVGDYNMIRSIDNGMISPILEFGVEDIEHNYYMIVNHITGNIVISIPLKKQIIEISDFEDDIDLKKLKTNYDIIAGNGNSCPPEDLCGDGSLAEDAQLTFPKGIVYGNDGTLYLLDSRKLRNIEKDGTIRTIISEKQVSKTDNCQDIFRFDDLDFIWPTSITIDQSTEDLYILDSDIIYKLNLKAKIGVIYAGQNKKCSTKNKNMITITNAQHITISQSERRLYYTEIDSKSESIIKSISLNYDYGTDMIVISGTKGTTFPSHLAFRKATTMVFDENNILYVNDEENGQVKKLTQIKAKFDEEKKVYKINNQEMNEIYHFDKNGRHLYTTDMITGTEKISFEYNLETSEIDKVITADDGILEINSNSKGERIITSNKGFVTTLSMKKCGKGKCLEEVINPDKTKISLKYNKNYSMTSKVIDSKTWIFKYTNENDPSSLSAIISPSGQNYSIGGQLLKFNGFETEVLLNGQLFTKIIVYANQPTYNFPTTVTTNLGTMLHSDVSSNFIKFKDGFTITNGEGLTSQYDKRSHPLLQENESSISKRKLVLRSIDNTKDLITKSEWRTFIKRSPSNTIDVVGNRPKVNGHTLFIVEFNRTIFSDVIKNVYEQTLFTVSYNMEREIISVYSGKKVVIPKFKKEYTKDSNNLLKRKSFGEFSINYLYDLRNRLMSKTYSNNHIMIRRLGYSSKDTDISYKPTMIQLPNGSKYLWRYDKEGNVISLKSPGGLTEEIHKFWNMYSGMRNDYIRYYRSLPYLKNNHLIKENNKDGSIREKINMNDINKFVLILDGNEKVSSFMTPDREKSLFVKRDIYGNIESMNIDGGCFIYGYYKNLGDKRIMSVNIYSNENVVERIFKYIGFLIHQVNESRGNDRFIVKYEYDSFLRVTSQLFKLNGNVIDLEMMTYDNEYGKLVDNDKEIFKRKSIENTNRQIIEENFLLYKKNFVTVKYYYDIVGRVVKREWQLKDKNYLVEKKEFGMNGELINYFIENNFGKNEWHVQYDISGRIRQINDEVIDKENGIIKKYGNMEYIRDDNGFIIKRGDWQFKYDVLGRLLAGKKDNLEIWYNYDDKGYIISKIIKKNGNMIDGIEFIYDKNGKLKYYWNKRNVDDVWTLKYDKSGEFIIGISQNDDLYWIVTDNENSLKLIIGNHGELIYEVNYTPTGQCLKDKKPRAFILPVGYRGCIEDHDMNIVFIEEYSEIIGTTILRPLDTFSGRFLSSTINIMNSRINLLNPEKIADPFYYDIGEELRPIEFSLQQWFKYSGYDFSFINYYFSENTLLNKECSSSKMVLSSTMCEGIESTIQLNNILSIKERTKEIEEQFFGKTFGNDFIENNNFDFTIVTRKDGKINLLRRNEKRENDLNILEKILDESIFIPISSEMIINDSFVEINFYKSELSNVQDDKKLAMKISHTVKIEESEKMKLLIFNVDDRIFKIYFSDNIKHVKNYLKKEYFVRMINMKWESERNALMKGLHFLSKNWTQKQIMEMIQNGRVKDVKSKLRVSPTYKYLPSSLDSWYFD
uniref:EGF-like domain-containing protein n=1 Tax=Parastrongyloides trichosuri TaxID=131310 RepID=A0A0N5A1X5_PARTI